MKNLPENIKQMFEDQIERQVFKYDIIRKIIDSDNETVYFIHEYKEDPEVSYNDFLNNEFIPYNDYYDPNLVLRTDFNDYDRNYVSTAYSLYVYKYVTKRETYQEIYEENPREDGKVDFEMKL